MSKVLVVGLGTVGYPTAQYLGNFFDVYGYDTKFRSGRNFTTVQSLNKIEPDVFVVCVPTNQVQSVCKVVARHDKLILIESTMQIGMCRKIAEGSGIGLLAHCPHRYWAVSPDLRGVRQLRVLGTLNSESLELAKQFYSKAEIPIHLVSILEVAEASKLVENASRFVNIAFAEEVKMLCDELGLSFEEVRLACNTKWNVHLLEARGGVKSTCLPQDIRLLTELGGKKSLMEGAIEADEKYKKGWNHDSCERCLS